MDLRVVTWNVQCATGADRNLRRLELILQADADIVVLTETHDELSLPRYGAVSTQPRPDARAGGRWTTIWSRLAARRCVPTADPLRTVAVEYEGNVLVYGTVLPWHTDCGPTGLKQTNWAEYKRVVPLQGAEWRSLRLQHPGHTLIVAGDFNQSLGDRHYYGGAALRQLLETECAAAGLLVLTGSADHHAPLKHPPIDHVAVAPPFGGRAHTRQITGWEGTWDGLGKLSDHSAVLVSVGIDVHHPDAF